MPSTASFRVSLCLMVVMMTLMMGIDDDQDPALSSAVFRCRCRNREER